MSLQVDKRPAIDTAIINVGLPSVIKNHGQLWTLQIPHYLSQIQ